MLAFDHFARSAYSSPSAAVVQRSPLGLRDGNSRSNASTAPSSLFAQKNLFSTYMYSGTENNEVKDHHSLANQRQRRVVEPRRRESKFAPLLRRRGGEEERQSRRNAYLTSSRRAGDDRIYQARMEQSWRREALDEQLEWQARLEAQHEEQPPIDEDEELRLLEEQQMLDAAEMEGSQMMDFPSDDDELYSYFMWSQEPNEQTEQLPTYQAEQQMQEDSNMASTEVWSDDEELERYLLEAARQAEEAQARQAGQPTTDQIDSEMT